ncbi:hypothetical protein JFL47_11350 [Haemophilus haemoglobinophilus]|nr:hypothetical protein [Canicola haemoglobinophilus]MBN6711809.1 hypothetical protein [Canicola haemoglobinophilus]
MFKNKTKTYSNFLNVASDELFTSRENYAKSIVSALNNVTHAFLLTDLRRRGKTEFLTRDVLPVALNQNYNVFYFSFMRTQINGEKTETCQAFINQLIEFHAENANDETFLTELESKILQRSTTLLNVKNDRNSALGLSKLELSDKKTQEKQTEVNFSSSNIFDVLDLIARHNSKRGVKLLLILDEIQELARTDENLVESFVANLRTVLDINKSHIKTIFTGSSVLELNYMFKSQTAPLFDFASKMELPLLNEEYLQKVANYIKQYKQVDISISDLAGYFKHLDFKPYYLNKAAIEFVINITDKTLEQIIQEQNESQNEIEFFKSANHFEQGIIKEIAHREIGLMSKETISLLLKNSKENFSESQAKSKIKALIDKMKNLNMLAEFKEGRNKRYLLVNHEFKKWLISLE